MAMIRRYFVAEGPDADRVREKVLQAQKLHRALHQRVMDKYKAYALYTKDSLIVGIAKLKGHAPPLGCKLDHEEKHGKDKVRIYKPLLNRKAGKAMDQDFKLAGGFNGSDLILQAFDCNAMIASMTDYSLQVAVAGIAKDTIVINIPEDESNPAKVHACFREIKHSEFVALTEEE